MGEHIHCTEGYRAQRIAVTIKGNFVLLPIIASNVKPVCCVVIFQSKLPEPKLEWERRIDFKTQPIRDDDGDINIASSSGPANYHPSGPQFHFNNLAIDCLTFCSKSVGMTTDILIKVFKYLVEKEVFPSLLMIKIIDWIQKLLSI